MEAKTITESVKYTFTGEELVAIAREQARFYGDMSRAVDAFETIRAQHKATVTQLEGQIAGCASRVTSGFEMRTVKCLVLKFRPDADSALIVRTDNGKVVNKRKLEASEKQMKLSEKDGPPLAWEADLQTDIVGDTRSSGLPGFSMEVFSNVPLTTEEAEELRDVVDLRPLS